MNTSHISKTFNDSLAIASILLTSMILGACTSETQDATVQSPQAERTTTATDAPAPAADEAAPPKTAPTERAPGEPAPPAMRKQAATQTKPPKPQGRSSEQVASSQPKPAAKPQADKTAEPSKPAAPPAPSPSVEIQPPATNPTPRTGPVAIPDAFPADLHPPQMLLTEAHAKTCLVKLGEPMPNLTLVDLEDNPQLLADLYGEKLTVVVFWSHSKVFAREQFARLKQEVQQPFSQFGVNVVAINVGDPADVVRSLAAEYDVDLLCLLDPDGTAFAQLATAKLPRTYLLDSQGTIRWFDIEYSQTTARDLRNAIYYYLQP